ncbi:MAG TPA: hypothetical protein VF846_14955 [Thermoanaerobaculia bacterium]
MTIEGCPSEASSDIASQTFRTNGLDAMERKRQAVRVPVHSLRHLASIAIAVFFCGTTVLPALHLAFHALPHEHVAAHTHEHEHDAEPHHHESEKDHGEGSLAHFSAAIGAEAAQPWTPTPIALICAGRIAIEEPAPRRKRSTRAHTVRGPPTLSFSERDHTSESKEQCHETCMGRCVFHPRVGRRGGDAVGAGPRFHQCAAAWRHY